MTRFLIVLGTTSHSGKSTLVAALCRLLRRRGLAVAPFKSQNMSLNSWVTGSGAEIGIAQACQAWAAGVDPTEFMNPILLKPKGDKTSQVIVLGRPVADRSAAEYYREIDGLKEVVDRSLAELGKDYDYVVVEGAGGAAEINLFERDIANIYVASRLRSPIILVGDIERGGVFASLFGTVQLLPPEIRSLVKGLVINKFRGDPEILGSGMDELERLTGIPVLGVLPYLDLEIPSEDSVSLGDKITSSRLRATGGDGKAAFGIMRSSPETNTVEIAVIKLPRISNFTDFEPLERQACVKYVAPGESLGSPDAIIIPGTKNTVSDLRDLIEKGMDRQILDLAAKGTPVLGICGGYQMLGREIVDCGIEDITGTVPALGLIDAVTRFDLYEKRTVQTRKPVTGGGPILGGIRGQMVSGYEIHMGVTLSNEPSAFGDDGAVGKSGTVIGTYLHGLFDNYNFREALLDFLYSRRNIERSRSNSGKSSEANGATGSAAPAESAGGDGFDDLANAVEKHLDMAKIWQMLGLTP